MALVQITRVRIVTRKPGRNLARGRADSATQRQSFSAGTVPSGHELLAQGCALRRRRRRRPWSLGSGRWLTRLFRFNSVQGASPVSGCLDRCLSCALASCARDRAAIKRQRPNHFLHKTLETPENDPVMCNPRIPDTVATGPPTQPIIATQYGFSLSATSRRHM